MGHWRSWLARLNGIEKVIGSNPICSTIIEERIATYRGPATSSLKTSIQEKIALQVVSGNFHPLFVFELNSKTAPHPLKLTLFGSQ